MASISARPPPTDASATTRTSTFTRSNAGEGRTAWYGVGALFCGAMLGNRRSEPGEERPGGLGAVIRPEVTAGVDTEDDRGRGRAEVALAVARGARGGSGLAAVAGHPVVAKLLARVG